MTVLMHFFFKVWNLTQFFHWCISRSDINCIVVVFLLSRKQ